MMLLTDTNRQLPLFTNGKIPYSYLTVLHVQYLMYLNFLESTLCRSVP